MLNEPPDGPSYMTTPTKQMETWIRPYDEYLRCKANEFNKLKWIYGLYGALDGLSTSFSMFKYFFEAYYANSSTSSSDALHDWTLTPEGLECVIFISGMLASLSCIANQNADNKTNNETIKFIVKYWPFARDTMKALKNTYKGLRNALVFADMYFPGHGYNSINILPAGIVLGVIAAMNRMWLRAIRDERKGLKKQNLQFVQELEAMLNRNSKEDNDRIEVIQQKLQSQSQFFWLCADLAAAFSGVIDAPYLYFGVLGVTLLVPGSWFFIVVATCSIAFAAACIATRIYEEHNYQRELLVTQLQVELAIYKRSLAILFGELKAISAPDSNLSEQLKSQTDVYDQLVKMWSSAKDCKAKLHNQSVLSWGAITLGGLKNGVDAYGALASMMFASATAATLLGWTYAPVLLVGFVVLGMACLMFFLTTALLQYQSHLIEKNKAATQVLSGPNEEQSMFTYFEDLKTYIQTKQPLNLDALDTHKKEILAGMIVDASPQFFFQEWFEVVRLWCSGSNKGIRAVDSMLIALQTLGDDGHYHDTHSMVIVAYFDAALYALIFALRGFARLGREKPKQNNHVINDSHPVNDAITSASSTALLAMPSREPSSSSLVSGRCTPFYNLSLFVLPPKLSRAISAPAQLESQSRPDF